MLWVLIRSTQQGISKEYPQNMFLWSPGENYPRIIIENSSLTNPLLALAQYLNSTVCRPK